MKLFIASVLFFVSCSVFATTAEYTGNAPIGYQTFSFTGGTCEDFRQAWALHRSQIAARPHTINSCPHDPLINETAAFVINNVDSGLTNNVTFTISNVPVICPAGQIRNPSKNVCEPVKGVTFVQLFVYFTFLCAGVIGYSNGRRGL